MGLRKKVEFLQDFKGYEKKQKVELNIHQALLFDRLGIAKIVGGKPKLSKTPDPIGDKLKESYQDKVAKTTVKKKAGRPSKKK